MANYFIMKFGRPLLFDKENFTANGGDIDAYNLVNMLTTHYPKDNFYIIGNTNYNKTPLRLFYNNIFVVKGDNQPSIKDTIAYENYYIERIKELDLKLDGGIVIDGISGFKWATHVYQGKNIRRLECCKRSYAPLIHFLNITKLPWVYIHTDFRQLGLKNTADMINLPKAVFSIMDYKRPGKKIKEDGTEYKVEVQYPYNQAELISLYNSKVNEDLSSKSSKELVIILNGGVEHKSRFDLLKPFLKDNVSVYGKWADECIKQYPDCFKGTVHIDLIPDILKKTKYTVVISLEPKVITYKYLEMIANGVIPFFHSTHYDIDKLLDVPEFIRLKSDEEIFEKIEYLENNPEEYESLIKQLQDKFMKPEYLDGSYMSNKIMSVLTDENTQRDSYITWKERV